MIVKIPIQYKPGSQILSQTMLFGDSYKTWDEQAQEFFHSRIKDIEAAGHAEFSKSKWIGYGGLKWCGEEYFQAALDEVPDAPGRLYSEMIFNRSTEIDEKIDEMLAKARRIAKI